MSIFFDSMIIFLVIYNKEITRQLYKNMQRKVFIVLSLEAFK